MTYIFSSRKASALGLSDKATWAKIVKAPKDTTVKSLRVLAGHKNERDDQVYLDISGLAPTELKRALSSLRKKCAGSFWGIIDPKGAAEDPASFFFNGASDYIGQAAVAKGLGRKRFVAAHTWFVAVKIPSLGRHASGSRYAGFQPVEKKKGQTLPAGKANLASDKAKLPSGKFKGWKSLRTGTTLPFFFLFVSLSGGEAKVSGRSSLRAQVGEVVFSAVKKRLRELLLHGLDVADALLWMETENHSLFLVPPTAAHGRAAVEASLKMILNSRLIGIEKLGLSFPVDFTFALHYGKTVFRAPGKTGAIISEPVNYIFHLGTKKAETGRLTVSDDVSEEAIPEGLSYLFSPVGTFEEIPICHSRRFIYK